MTRRVVLSLAALLLLGLFVPTVVAEDPAHRVEFRGVISAVTDFGIAVETDRGTVRVHVNERTRIFRNGERVRLHSLQVRDHVFVRGELRVRGDRRFVLAHVIHARGR